MEVEVLWLISRICISGEGTEALLLEDPHSMDRTTHGLVGTYQIDITLEQAKKLVVDLQKAIIAYEELNVWETQADETK